MRTVNNSTGCERLVLAAKIPFSLGAGYGSAASHSHTQTQRKGYFCLRQPMNGYIYIVRSPGSKLYKIGRTTELGRRFRRLQKITRGTITLLTWITTTDVVGDEAQLHDAFWRKRKIGEWFALDEQDLDRLTDLLQIFQERSNLIRRIRRNNVITTLV